MGSACSEEVLELVCSSEELQEGDCKEVQLKENKILLIRQDGTVRGLSGKCTHYGAPLVKGVVGSNSLVCPYHGACYNLTTGDIEDFPGLSSLVSYQVEETSGGIYVSSRGLNTGETARERRGGVRPVTREETVVVVGAGAAGHTAIETFRAEGYSGRLVLLSAETILPYDRPKLSKKLNASPGELLLRSENWYKEAQVEVHLGVEVTQVQPEEQIVLTSSGERYSYDKLLVCTGGSPRHLGVPGEDLQGIYTLRTHTDANSIYGSVEGKHVVIVGGSFIGMEVAASVLERSATVTVVDRNRVSFESSLGPEVGAILQQLHTDRGVRFCMEDGVDSFQGSEGRVETVVLLSGKQLNADVVLVGAGVVPSTQALSTIEGFLDSRGLVTVDQFMQTTDKNIFAAGDIVKFPLLHFDGEMTNIGHWGLAMYLGKIAALSIMGRQEPAATVPFFWTVQYGKSVRFAGTTKDCDSINVDQQDGTFLAVYSKEGKVRGVATLGRDPVAAYFKTLASQGKVLFKDDAMQLLQTCIK